MANTKDTFQVWRSYGTGTGGYRMLEPMTEAELAARTVRQKAHQVMLERQDAYESSRQVDPPPAPTPLMGCVFAKSCNLPSGLIDYHDPTGFVPLERLKDYGEYALLGGRETDESGVLPLRKISGSVLPAGLGTLALAGSVTGSVAAAGASTVGAAFLAGLVALIWPSSLGGRTATRHGEGTHAGSLAYRATRGRNAQGIRVLHRQKSRLGNGRRGAVSVARDAVHRRLG